MNWLVVRLDTGAQQAEAAEDALLAAGAAAVTLEDNANQPLFAGETPTDPTLWTQTRISGLFPAEQDVQQLLQSLSDSSELTEQAKESLRAEILEDKDWELEWMQHYAPLQIAPDFWLCPSWHEPPEPDATNLLLDPGLAFGTGTHPTTAMCLRALATHTPAGGRVVDFGCGSGILSVAALLLGAKTVLATDTDQQALSATWANCERNSIEAGRLQVMHPDALHGAEQADLVIANILAGPLCALAPQLCDMLAHPNAGLILSGILEEQVSMLQESYPIPLHVIDRQDGWVALGTGNLRRASA